MSTKPNTVICLDPSSGKTNGVARWEKQEDDKYKIAELNTYSSIDVIELLDTLKWHCKELWYFSDNPLEIRIADDSAISAIYAGKIRQSDPLPAKLKTAERVGMVKAMSKLYIDLAKQLVDQYPEFVKLITIPNNAKNPTKNNPELFKQLTGWTKLSNEHTRDAAMLYLKKGTTYQPKK